ARQSSVPMAIHSGKQPHGTFRADQVDASVQEPLPGRRPGAGQVSREVELQRDRRTLSYVHRDTWRSVQPDRCEGESPTIRKRDKWTFTPDEQLDPGHAREASGL